MYRVFSNDSFFCFTEVDGLADAQLNLTKVTKVRLRLLPVANLGKLIKVIISGH